MIASTGQVERGFSTRTPVLDAHLGQRTRADKTPDNAEIFTEIGLDGPDDESGLFSRNIFGDYKQTPLAKECAELWMYSQGGAAFTRGGRMPGRSASIVAAQVWRRGFRKHWDSIILRTGRESVVSGNHNG